MKNKLSFNYKESEVKTIIKNGEILFCASDIGNILGLSNVYRQLKEFSKGVHTMKVLTNGGEQSIIYINEPNLYALIFKSRKKESKKFKDWVFEEVLPSIRKTGKYEIGKQLKSISTSKRNELTSMWKEHGCSKPYHYINLTREEYKLLFDDAKKKKANMTREEILTLSALESMEALSLFHGNKNGYYECRDNLKETSNLLSNITKKEISNG